MTPFPVVSIEEAIRSASLDTHQRLPVVLIVDDEKIIANTLTAIFNHSGYNAIAAYDGPSALQLAAAIPPDLIITDVMMPGMNGIDLAITLEKLYPRCKIMLFSGQAGTVDLLATARTLGHEFTTLTKPVHPTEMLRHVSECLNPSAAQTPAPAGL